MRNVTSAFLALILIGGAVTGCKETGSDSDPTNGIQISAGSLLAEYEENEVAADERYKGRALAVTGVIDSIGKDMFDTMYVTLGTKKEVEFNKVQCMFSDQYKAQVSSLRKGNELRVVGICNGKIVGNVLLRKCSIRP